MSRRATECKFLLPSPTPDQTLPISGKWVSGTVVAVLPSSMIIEAGYDIVELLLNGVANRRKTDTEDDDENPLWVLTMDAQLRYWSTSRVVDRMGASSDEHIEDIARKLNEEPRYSAYYVLAHTTRVHHRDNDDCLYNLDQFIKNHPDLQGHELLGQVVFDETGFFSTVPRYSFRDYAGLEHLPRAASFAGPHEWSNCPCPACVQHEQLLEENRARFRNSPPGPIQGAVNEHDEPV